jgi:hypothetical protein
MNAPTITLPDEAYAICKKHPWLLFKVAGKHYAHRKEVRRLTKDGTESVREATTVEFTMDNEDMSQPTRDLFAHTIKEMEQGLT